MSGLVQTSLDTNAHPLAPRGTRKGNRLRVLGADEPVAHAGRRWRGPPSLLQRCLQPDGANPQAGTPHSSWLNGPGRGGTWCVPDEGLAEAFASAVDDGLAESPANAASPGAQHVQPKASPFPILARAPPTPLGFASTLDFTGLAGSPLHCHFHRRRRRNLRASRTARHRAPVAWTTDTRPIRSGDALL
jgi:hypothetical protein